MALKRHFTLRISILTIFVTLFVVLVLSLIFIVTIIFSGTLLFVSNELMSQASATVVQELSSELKPPEAASELSARLIHDNTLDVSNQQQLITYTTNLVKELPQVQMAYWGNEQGDLIGSHREMDGTIAINIIERNKITDTSATDVWIYRDALGAIKKRNETPTTYDPRNRPWYIASKQAKTSVWSDVYAYQTGHILGVTYASPVFGMDGKLMGVFGVDVKLDAITDFLTRLHISDNGIAFVINAHDELVAFPHLEKFVGKNNLDGQKLVPIEAIEKPWLAQSFYRHEKTGQDKFSYVYKGIRYLDSFQKVPGFSAYGWVIDVVVPENDFVGKLKKLNFIVTGISIVILLIGTYLVSMLSERIARPLKLLVTETNKIKNFELDDKKPIDSYIKEVDYLAKAIDAMKSGLKSFQRYVPASLVRQLIQSGEDVHLGGAKKDLTVLFTDIKNFTTISESMDPELLMLHLCDYFDELSKIIVTEKGTIDKYIGDSVMAFWGAPLTDDEHCWHACIAALRCQKRLTELNVRWQEEGKPPFITRIGIHTGDAIVGNIGSSERLNYTVLGDSINIASRLEGTNKFYGTKIIVSEKVAKILGDKFAFRLLDCVAVKGKEKSTFIYELMDEDVKNLPFDLASYQEKFEKGFAAYQAQRWDEAITQFKKCLEIFPTDTVAPIFINRCETFKENPPAKDWNGVFRAELH